MFRFTKNLKVRTILSSVDFSTRVQRSSGGVYYNAPKKILTPTNYPPFDWMKKGLVTPAKDQGNHSTCWSMAPMTALETLQALHTQKLISLSSQYVIARSPGQGREGTDGELEWVYEMALRKGGRLPLWKNCPYILPNFNFDPVQLEQLFISGYYWLNPYDLVGLVDALKKLPITVGFPAFMELYEYECDSGIITTFTYPRNKKLRGNHGAAIIGYGYCETTGKPFLRLKNSWGSHWGNNQGCFDISTDLRIFRDALQPYYDPLIGVGKPTLQRRTYTTMSSTERHLPEDGISSFLDDALLFILSSLTSKEMVETCIPPGGWLNMWVNTLFLDIHASISDAFEIENRICPNYVERVNHFLRRQEGHYLNQFQTGCTPANCEPKDINRWLEFALAINLFLQQLEM